LRYGKEVNTLIEEKETPEGEETPKEEPEKKPCED